MCPQNEHFHETFFVHPGTTVFMSTPTLLE